MIQFANQHEIDNHSKEQRAKIYDSYIQTGKRKEAVAITKAQLEEEYPQSQWERYSLQSLHKFRTELMKGGDENADETFKQATSDLKHFVVHHDGKKTMLFLRKKEQGE